MPAEIYDKIFSYLLPRTCLPRRWPLLAHRIRTIETRRFLFCVENELGSASCRHACPILKHDLRVQGNALREISMDLSSFCQRSAAEIEDLFVVPLLTSRSTRVPRTRFREPLIPGATHALSVLLGAEEQGLRLHTLKIVADKRVHWEFLPGPGFRIGREMVAQFKHLKSLNLTPLVGFTRRTENTAPGALRRN